jgi:hypothetical protein
MNKLISINVLLEYMAEEDHRNLKKIQCWIPISIWDELKERGYPTISKAVNEALEKLLGIPQEIPYKDISGMQKFPEFPELKARIEEKDKQIEDKDRHIESLKKELESAGQREQDLKQMHSNYMMQMQTLINQRAIEVPGAKKPWWRFW